MNDFTVDWPADIDTYSQPKGWINLPVKSGGRTYSVTFFDPVRLGQEIGDALSQNAYFAELNLVVVDTIERATIDAALQSIANRGDFQLFRPDDLGDATY